MKIGMLTGPMRKTPLPQVIAFAREAGFEQIEIACPSHLDPENVTQDEKDAIKAALGGDVSISGLACYTTDLLSSDEEKRAAAIRRLEAAIAIAPELGTDVVCTLGGMPHQGKSKIETIQAEAEGVFGPLAEKAAANGVKLALENWYATNIGNMPEWEAMFEAVPHPSFGLNFDPSHLVWQDIDPIAAVDHFADRIFHTHAKDVEIRWDKRRWAGNQGSGWWRYVIPGRGDIAWGPYFGALRRNGFNGVTSIEHEDSSVGVEEGFRLGQRFLTTVV